MKTLEAGGESGESDDDRMIPDAYDAGVVDSDPCVTFGVASAVGRVENDTLAEISGVVSSRQHLGVLWVHNDSGGDASVSAIDVSGRTLGHYRLRDVHALDWEDIAIGPGVSGDDLFVGDIGDNRRQRPNVVIYRFEEPRPVVQVASAVSQEIVEFRTYRFSYPLGASYDAETLLFDPSTSDIYIITKEASGRSILFRAALPRDSMVATLERVAQLNIPGLVPMATAGDIAPDGDAVILRTYTDILLWPRPPGMSLGDCLQMTPRVVAAPPEGQGEAIGFAADRTGFYTISEGIGPEIFYSQCIR